MHKKLTVNVKLNIEFELEGTDGYDISVYDDKASAMGYIGMPVEYVVSKPDNIDNMIHAILEEFSNIGDDHVKVNFIDTEYDVDSVKVHES